MSLNGSGTILDAFLNRHSAWIEEKKMGFKPNDLNSFSYLLKIREARLGSVDGTQYCYINTFSSKNTHTANQTKALLTFFAALLFRSNY